MLFYVNGGKNKFKVNLYVESAEFIEIKIFFDAIPEIDIEVI